MGLKEFVSPLLHFVGVEKENPLSLSQLTELGKLEIIFNKKDQKLLEILPGRDKIKGLPVYMIVTYKQKAIAKVFPDHVQELRIFDKEFKPQDYVKIEELIKKINLICQRKE